MKRRAVPASAVDAPAPPSVQACLRPISLADIVKAFQALGLEGDAGQGPRRALGCLGLELRQAPPPPPPSPPIVPGQPAKPPGAPAPDVVPPPHRIEPPTPPPPKPDAKAESPPDLEVLEPAGYMVADSPDQVLDDVEVLDQFDPARHARALPPPDPLLPAPRNRAILAALGSTWHAGREVDVERVTHLLAARRPVWWMPRRPKRGLAWQVQVLLDLSEGMLPFRRDQDELVAALGSVLGRESLEVVCCHGCPLNGSVLWPGRGWRRYAYPPPGTPVIVASDVGAAPAARGNFPGSSLDWTDFALGGWKRDCTVVVLNPYARHRWPPALGRELIVLEWDLALSVSEALRPVLQVRRNLLKRLS